MNVSFNIKSLRGLKGLTQDDLAEKLHVTRQTISNWETGKSEPDFESLETLAGVFEVTVSELLGEEKDMQEPDPDRYPVLSESSDIAEHPVYRTEIIGIPWGDL